MLPGREGAEPVHSGIQGGGRNLACRNHRKRRPFLKEILEKSGVKTCYLRDSGQITGHALIQVSGEGENCIILFNGSNYENDRAFIDDVLKDFSEGDILLLQNEISNLDYLLQRGKEKGLRIMLNPSPMDENLRNMDLSGVTWLMLNETEGKEMTGESEAARIADALVGRYPRMNVILTLGKDGALYQNGKKRFKQPCFPAETVDTTAAGDTFTGYFIASSAFGKTEEEAMKNSGLRGGSYGIQGGSCGIYTSDGGCGCQNKPHSFGIKVQDSLNFPEYVLHGPFWFQGTSAPSAE